MKHAILIFALLALASCGVSRRQATALDDIIVYDNFRQPPSRRQDPMMYTVGPDSEALILRRNAWRPEFNSYEHYLDGDVRSVVGKWRVEGDTLYLFPLYEYRYDTMPEMRSLHPIDTTGDWSRHKIEQKWLIAGDEIHIRSDSSAYARLWERDVEESGLSEDELWFLRSMVAMSEDRLNNSLTRRSKAELTNAGRRRR